MKRRVAFIIFGLGFLLGAICFKVVDTNKAITFDPTFNFGNVIWAVTTVLVAITVASYLQRQTQSDRSEKDLLLRQLEVVLAAVADFENTKTEVF